MFGFRILLLQQIEKGLHSEARRNSWRVDVSKLVLVNPELKCSDVNCLCFNFLARLQQYRNSDSRCL